MKYFDIDKKRKGLTLTKTERARPERAKRVEGFTLIEVMITIIIIGILSTLGISTFQSTQKKGRDVKRKADLYAVVKALEGYMSDNGVYPNSKTEFGEETGKILWCGPDQDSECEWGDPFSTSNTGEDEQGDQTSTVYMASLPKETLSAQTFVYEGVETDGKVKGYKLYARLENDRDQDIPSSGQYEPTCRPTDTTNTKYCNYAITSDTVAAPIGCDIDKSSCVTAATCCSGKCYASYYAYSAILGYTGHCTPTSFCGMTAPSGYITAIGRSIGETCTSGKRCCSGTCTSNLYVDNDHNGFGDSCTKVSVCTNGSTIPFGFADKCVQCWASNGVDCDSGCTKRLVAAHNVYTTCTPGIPCGCWGYGGVCDANCLYSGMVSGTSYTLCGRGSCDCGQKTCWGGVPNTPITSYSGSGTCSSSGLGSCYRYNGSTTTYYGGGCGVGYGIQCSSRSSYTSYLVCSWITRVFAYTVSTPVTKYTGSGTCNANGTGTCYKLSNGVPYYTGNGPACPTGGTCPSGTYSDKTNCTWITR